MNPKARFDITASDETKSAVSSAMRGLDGIGAKAGVVGVAISAVTSGAMAAFLKSQIDNADAMDKLARKMNMSTESASAFGYAARFSDMDTNQLAQSVKALSQAQVDAQKAGSDHARIFEALGVATREANGDLRGSDELLMDLADAFKLLPDGALKTDAAVKLFKGNALELLDVLKDGRGGLEAFAREAEQTGNIISGDTGKAAAEFNDNLERIGLSMQGIANQALPPLLAGLNKLNELFGVQAAKPLPMASDWAMDKMEQARQQIAGLNDELASVGRGTHISSLWGRDAEEIRAEIAQQQAKIIEYGKMREQVLEAEAKMAKAGTAPDSKKLSAALSGVGAGAAEMSAEAYGNNQAELLKKSYPGAIKAGDEYVQHQQQIFDAQITMGDAMVEAYYTQQAEMETARQGALMAHEYDLMQRVAGEESAQMTIEQRQMAAFDNRQLMIDEAAARGLISEERQTELLAGIEKDRQQKITDIAKEGMQQRLAVASGMMSNMSSLMQSDSQRQFDIGKKFALANALIKGYEAITSSYAAGAKIGGPFLGAAYAATAAVATKVNIDAIRGQQFGGGGGAAPGAGGSLPVNPNTGVTEVPISSSSQSSAPVQQVTINVHGNMVDLSDLARSLRPYNIELARDVI